MNTFGLLCFLGIPAAVFVGFIVCLVKYKKCPTEPASAKNNWRTAMIITGTISLVFVILIVALIALLSLAITNM